ncbi:MAG TPA: mercury methylation corrinoid protein HgcA [Spirochaetia bacterium]|nr:mercury methylation corrinoid protein HgcA [Spirochaetia bacterium]
MQELKANGFIEADGRRIPVVPARLSPRDILGGWKVRWGIGRNRYSIQPGLYAVGAPNAESPLLVTANYKLSFDRLRAELAALDAWILVLDTRGINVWCAAGKGTFGTRELEQKLLSLRPGEIVSHRTLILPQLGATGVSAPEVREATGWRVVFGPVRARDLPAFVSSGLRKNAAMRRVEFRFADRMAVAPIELVQSWPFLLGITAASVLLAIPFGPGFPARLLSVLLPLIGAVLVGTVFFPALLPVLPFRAFSLKGALIGIAWGLTASIAASASIVGSLALILVAAPVASFLAMGFTGASTFTCQAGAEMEVRRGVIPMIVSAAIGGGLLAASRYLGV